MLEAAGIEKQAVLEMVGRTVKPLVQRKLEELDVQPEDLATVSTALDALLAKDNTQKLQASSRRNRYGPIRWATAASVYCARYCGETKSHSDG